MHTGHSFSRLSRRTFRGGAGFIWLPRLEVSQSGEVVSAGRRTCFNSTLVLVRTCHEPHKGSKRGDQHLIKWNSCLCTVFTHDPAANPSTQDSIHLIQPLSALALPCFSCVRLFQREDYSLVIQALSFFLFSFEKKETKYTLEI